MIKNSLNYTKNYYSLSKRIEIALKYLENTDLASMSNGRYEILGNEIFVNIQDYNTKPESEGKWEVHRKYIDIQYIIKGSERVGIGEIQDFKSVMQYDEDNDFEFLKTDKNLQFIDLNENEYLILYPYDVHMPQIMNKESSYVKKAVVKVLV